MYVCVFVCVCVCVWGGGDNKGRKTWGRDRGEADEGITKLTTNVISAAAEREQCLLFGEAFLSDKVTKRVPEDTTVENNLAIRTSNPRRELPSPR